MVEPCPHSGVCGTVQVGRGLSVALVPPALGQPAQGKVMLELSVERLLRGLCLAREGCTPPHPPHGW